MEKPTFPVVACVLLEDLSYARRKGDILYMDVASYEVDYKPYVRHIDASELQTLLEQGAYEFVLTKGNERKYVIQPTLQRVAMWIFDIPRERLDEFDYELY